MKWLNDYRMRLVFVGIVSAIVLGGESTRADFTFGESMNLGPPINTSYNDVDQCIAADGLSLLFGSNRPGGYGGNDIWVATRPTHDEPWNTAFNLGPTVNSPYHESDPSLSADGLSLFFCSHRPGGSGGSDLYVTTRSTVDEPWNEPVNLGQTVNSTGNDSDPSISADGLSLYFSTWQGPRPDGLGGDDIWITTRSSIAGPWGEPINLGPPVNTDHQDTQPGISSDGLALFFLSTSSYDPSGSGGAYITTRATTDSPWAERRFLNPYLQATPVPFDLEVSADGLTLYFGSNHQAGGVGAQDIWQAPIIPIVDLNRDGIIDSADMCIVVDHWGTDESLCDIGPMPWGDGIVNVQDLIVLAEHLFEEFPPAE